MDANTLARHIPPEVKEAAKKAAKDYIENATQLTEDGLYLAALAAGLANWPSLRMMVDIDTGDDAALKLPLSTEPSNDKA